MLDPSQDVVGSASLPSVSSANHRSDPIGRLQFRIRSGPYRDQRIAVRSDRCTIGRSPGCTIRLAEGDGASVECLVIKGRAITIVRRWGEQTRLNGEIFDDAILEIGDRLEMPGLNLEYLGLTAATALGRSPAIRRRPSENASGRPSDDVLLDHVTEATFGNEKRIEAPGTAFHSFDLWDRPVWEQDATAWPTSSRMDVHSAWTDDLVEDTSVLKSPPTARSADARPLGDHDADDAPDFGPEAIEASCEPPAVSWLDQTWSEDVPAVVEGGNRWTERRIFLRPAGLATASVSDVSSEPAETSTSGENAERTPEPGSAANLAEPTPSAPPVEPPTTAPNEPVVDEACLTGNSTGDSVEAGINTGEVRDDGRTALESDSVAPSSMDNVEVTAARHQIDAERTALAQARLAFEHETQERLRQIEQMLRQLNEVALGQAARSAGVAGDAPSAALTSSASSASSALSSPNRVDSSPADESGVANSGGLDSDDSTPIETPAATGDSASGDLVNTALASEAASDAIEAVADLSEDMTDLPRSSDPSSSPSERAPACEAVTKAEALSALQASFVPPADDEDLLTSVRATMMFPAAAETENVANAAPFPRRLPSFFLDDDSNDEADHPHQAARSSTPEAWAGSVWDIDETMPDTAEAGGASWASSFSDEEDDDPSSEDRPSRSTDTVTWHGSAELNPSSATPSDVASEQTSFADDATPSAGYRTESDDDAEAIDGDGVGDPWDVPSRPSRKEHSAWPAIEEPTFEPVREDAPLSAADILRKYGLGDDAPAARDATDADERDVAVTGTSAQHDGGDEVSANGSDETAWTYPGLSSLGADDETMPTADDDVEFRSNAPEPLVSVVAESDDPEGDISSYMQQLLERMRHQSPSRPATPVAPAKPVEVQTKKTDPQPVAPVRVQEPRNSTVAADPMTWAEYRPRAMANESKDDLNRMRQIANETARDAVTASRMRMTRQQCRNDATMTGFALMASLATLGISPGLSSVTGLAAVAGLTVTAWMGLRAWKSYQAYLRLIHQFERRAEETLDAENQRRVAARAAHDADLQTGSASTPSGSPAEIPDTERLESGELQAVTSGTPSGPERPPTAEPVPTAT